MKPAKLLVAVAAVAMSAACNGERSGGEGGSSGPAEVVAPPQGQTWEQVVSKTAEGGFLMGNPNAPVKLVEYGSMTCPHCAEFDENVDELVNDYVKTGQVSFEFRNYVRDGLDMAMALVARCGGEERFFPLTHALFESQRELFEKAQSVPPEQAQTLTQSPQGYAQLAGLQQWAAQRGIPEARLSQCLADQSEMDRLVQIGTDANTQYSIPGTPAFLINGELVERSAGWETLEPKIREAIGG